MMAYRIVVKRLLRVLLVGAVLLYIADYAQFRVRMARAKPNDPLETLTSLRVLAIPEKNGKTEYEVDAQNPQQTVTCVHALFPHSGYSPCWYVKPRINQPIPM
jgi:hypothetical protein